MHSVLTHKALLFVKLLRYIGVGCQRHNPAALPLVKRSGTHCTGSWMGPKTGLAATRIRSPDRPARSESLSRESTRKYETF